MALTDYSSLEGEINDAPEPIVLAKGTEVKARIINVRVGEDKNGVSYFMPVFDVPAEPLALEFSDFFHDLVDADKLDEKGKFKAFRKFRAFAQAFGIDYSAPFEFEDFIGNEGWLIVGYQKDDEYGDKNTVSKYIQGS